MTQPRTKDWVVEPGVTATTNYAVRASALTRGNAHVDTATPPK